MYHDTMGAGKDTLKNKNKKEKRGKKRSLITILLTFAAAAVAVVLIIAIFLPAPWVGRQRSGNSDSVNSLEIEQRPRSLGAVLSTEKAAEKILPSIVGVVQYRVGSLTETGEGSGVIMSADGKVITNFHVIDGAERLEVVLRSGKRYPASVMGSDARTDIAVLRIPEKGLKYARFGDSGECRVGETVIAVGNPSGLMLAGSVTQGIISALDRSVDIGSGPMKLIQTDAAINPGNSGGALVNMYGQVIGINSAKIAQTGYEGLGFSIPVKSVKGVVDSILKYGCVKGRVRIGVSCRSVAGVAACMSGVPEGVYVESIAHGGNAEKSGLLAGDVITAADGRTVKDTGGLVAVRDRHKAGDIIYLTVLRQNGSITLTLGIPLEEDRGEVATSDGC